LDLNGFNQTLAGLTNVTRNLRRQWVVNTSSEAATLTIDNSGDFTFSGLLGSTKPNFGLTKSGIGTFTISGINTYTGATMITKGKLVGVTGGSCAASSVTVANPTGALGVSISDNTKVWTCDNLAFAAAGALDFNFGSVSPSDTVAPLVVTNAVDFTATPTVIARGASFATLPVGSYPLMTCASLSGAIPASVLLPPTMDGNLTVTGNTLYLNITKASALPLYWVAGDGVWDINTSLNWKDSTGATTTYQESPAGSAAVVFDDVNSGAGLDLTITVPADVTPAGITLDHSVKNFSLGGPGVINGTAGLTKLGTGTLTLANACTYTGPTAISSGTLKLAAADRLPDGTGKGNLTVDGTLDLNGFSETINGLSGFGTVDTVSVGTPVLTVGNANASSTFDGVIQNTAGALALAKTGTGTLTLTGTNTHTGGTEITGGIVSVTHASALGTGAVTFNGGIRLVIGTELEVANAITMGANNGVVGRALAEAGTTAGTATLSGPVTINNSAVAGGHFAAPTAGTILHVKGPITSAVPVLARTGTVMLSGGGTGYTDFTIIQGTLMVGADNGIATTANVFCGSAGAVTLDLNGFSQSLVGIAKGTTAATIGNSSTSMDSTLTTTGTSTFGGVIQDVLGAGDKKVNLTVNGGEFTLSGANTYTGTTTLSAGTLTVGASHALADTTPVVIGHATLGIGAGFTDAIGTLDAAGNATINLGAGATLAFADSSGVSWSGTLNLAGTFASGTSLRFGTSSSGLTSAQLARIAAPGFGSFALDENGFLTASSTGGYAAWAATHAPTGTAKDDYDGDGVSNGVEYVLGGTKDTNDLGKLPKVAVSGGNLVVTFERDQDSINSSTTVDIEVGTDLAAWPDSHAVPDGPVTSIPGVSIVKDTPTTGTDTITLTLPQAPPASKFARLKVTVGVSPR
jgi:autotransporter-associated beta strand protein